MSELQCVARLVVRDGKLDDLQRLAAKRAELVRNKDTGTLQHELYVNSDNTAYLVVERYRDSQVVLDLSSRGHASGQDAGMGTG